MKSKYRMGWLFVCFDLPVVEKEDLRKANHFRKDLLKLGYFMLQNSIYVRSCVTYDKTNQFIKTLKMIAPDTGSVHVFYVTDVQWSNSICIENSSYHHSKYKKKLGENADKQMTLW
ncbi:MAG: CRISPR-associated endonuclease Cas2 [Candidatus Gastranaerophilales bacterium]|nr:CRISPR-associated endonuclease Cas2 [Candidatus Gastranaerophilales bacterium]